ncbi:MAG: LysM peptidoglycan-binding domain-containing protein [Cyanothece sp. SIO1E1]|nr:LysM peptidoglycan-binding domain-containing protein [Cyanothece sp. SIO1E1]
MTGELTKVEIRAFKDKSYTQPLGKFELPINPEQFSQSFKVSYDQQQAAGSQGTDPDFKVTKPEKLVLNFTFDGTGVVPVKGKANTFHKDVTGQVEELLKLTYVMNSETHKPNFLRLLWGNASFGDQNSFDCILEDLNIDYTLFAPDGKPLRAKLKATFLSYVEPKRRVREEGKQSPDVTHVRTVKAGETLPLMAYRIYGDHSYYLQVAKANGLVNFRRLRTNTTLQFPPIDKTSL